MLMLRRILALALAVCVATSVQTSAQQQPRDAEFNKVEVKSSAADALKVTGGIEVSTLSVGAIPSTVGAIRIATGASIFARNDANTSNHGVIGFGTVEANKIEIGQTGNPVIIRDVGPHAIGGATSVNYQLLQTGSMPAGPGAMAGQRLESTINVAANQQAFGYWASPTFVEAASGTHPLIASVAISAATVTAGAGAVTDTASLYIGGAMAATVTGKNYAAWIGGLTRIDGNLNFNAPTSVNVALVPNGTTLEVWLGDISGGGNLSSLTAKVTSAFIGPGTVATTGDWRARHGFEFKVRDNGNTADWSLLGLGVVATNEFHLGTPQANIRIRSNLATPLTLADGDWWMECTGTSPSRVCAIKVRDGGATRTPGSVTF